jgi:hypothetical protein
MKNQPKTYTTGQIAADVGLRASTVWRACKRYPRFALRGNNHFKIPAAHRERLLAGETIRQIAASPSVFPHHEAA